MVALDLIEFWNHFMEIDNLSYFFFGVVLAGIVLGLANFLYTRLVIKSFTDVIVSIKDQIKASHKDA